MRTTREAREEILRELGTAVELLELSTTRLGDAFELMSEKLDGRPYVAARSED